MPRKAAVTHCQCALSSPLQPCHFVMLQPAFQCQCLHLCARGLLEGHTAAPACSKLELAFSRNCLEQGGWVCMPQISWSLSGMVVFYTFPVCSQDGISSVCSDVCCWLSSVPCVTFSASKVVSPSLVSSLSLESCVKAGEQWDRTPAFFQPSGTWMVVSFSKLTVTHFHFLCFSCHFSYTAGLRCSVKGCGAHHKEHMAAR